jgi:hypothetical protein
LRALGVEVVRGTDAARGVTYVIVRQHGIVWAGLALALNVAWVREPPLQGKRAGPTEEFWVLTTDESLRAEEMREVAHIRWTIENHGFKTLNALVGSPAVRDAYLKNAHARHALLLIWSIGLTLLNAYTLELESQHGKKGWGLKITRWQWLAQWIEWSAIADEIEPSGGSP